MLQQLDFSGMAIANTMPTPETAFTKSSVILDFTCRLGRNKSRIRRSPMPTTNHVRWNSSASHAIKSGFPLVFQALSEYGFRRNAYALKFIGFASATLSFIGCSMFAIYDWGTQPQTALATKFGLFNILLVLLWLFWITEKAVKITAERYARFLLEAALDLEVKDGDNSLSER